MAMSSNFLASALVLVIALVYISSSEAAEADAGIGPTNQRRYSRSGVDCPAGPPLTSQGDPLSNHCCAGCRESLETLLFEANTEDQCKALDAFGRPVAGHLVGHTAWYGHFGECTRLQDSKYCLVSLTVGNAVLPTTVQNNTGMKWGVCVPSSCTEDDLLVNMDLLLKFMRDTFNTELNGVSAQVYPCVEGGRPSRPYSTGFYITVILFAVIFALMIAGSIVDWLEQYNAPAEENEPVESRNVRGDLGDAKTPLRAESSREGDDAEDTCLGRIKAFLLAFALSRNLSRLMAVDEKNSGIPCLHGMRAISMLLIIAMHVFSLEAPFAFFNEYAKWEARKGTFFQIIIGSAVVVDTFFFLGGTLVCYNTLMKLDKQDGSLRWHWFYIHRYLRVTPLLGSAILIEVFIQSHTYWGPLMTTNMGFTCYGGNWWRTLLYIQNYFGFMNMCYPLSWYLAVDMQLFVISPVVIYSLYRKPALGVGILSLAMVVAVAITAYAVILYGLPASTFAMTSFPNGLDVYGQTYLRMPPYLIGILLGYVLFKTRDADKPKPSMPVTAIIWGVAIVLAGVVLLTTLGHQGPMGTDPSLGRFLDVTYQMFSRVLWGGFLFLVVISCQFGFSEWVNKILSWGFWVPLSRCSYAVFLFHMMILIIYQMNLPRAIYYSLFTQTFAFFGIATAAYLVSGLLYLAIELPVAQLERLYLPRP